MFAVVREVRLLPMSMKFPPGTISRRYPRICDSAISFNREEFAVEYLKRLLFRIASRAATSLGEVPVPLNRRMGALPDPLSARTPQAVTAVEIRTREAMMRTRHGVSAIVVLSCARAPQSEHPDGFERRAARAGRIAVRHQLDPGDLFFTLNRHAGSHFADEPVAKRSGRFHGPAANQERVGVEHVDHLIDEQAERARLHPENLESHRVSAVGQAADPDGGFRGLDAVQRM